MEYKIRANNQKEAVEVYKAIRQIQQGKHNIAVNADSMKDAVRIYKEAKRVCDSKIKDFVVGNMEAYEWWNKHGGTGYWDDDLILEWPFDTKKRATEYFNEMKSALPNVKMHLAKKRNRYVIVFDSKFTDSKLKDKQNLVRGDWFVRINDLVIGSYVNIPLYKVLDMQTHDDGMIYVDVYRIKSDIKQNKTMLVHSGTSFVKLPADRYGTRLSAITIFSSADEALKWAKQKVATYNAKR